MELEKQIQELNLSNIFIKFFETGSGVPTSSLIMDYSGASKTIHSVESLYSKDAFDERFYTDERFVSVERLKLIMESDEIINNIKNGKYNTCFASTFQVGSDISTHGWIGIRYNDDINYYHISIHEHKTRKEYIQLIGEIGLKLLTKIIGIENNDYCVDIVLDSNLNYNHKETLYFLTQNKNLENASIFKSNNSICRIEDILRETEELVLYKGSFNFIHNQHLDIMNKSLSINNKGLFCISVNTYQKISNNILKRIEYINDLGYDVLVLNKPLYIDNINFIRNKFKGKIILPMGEDTLERFLSSYKNIKFIHTDNVGHCVYNSEQIENDFVNCEFISYLRNEINIDIDCKIIKKENNDFNDISSSNMRKWIEEKNHVELQKIVPNKILNKIINEI